MHHYYSLLSRISFLIVQSFALITSHQMKVLPFLRKKMPRLVRHWQQQEFLHSQPWNHLLQLPHWRLEFQQPGVRCRIWFDVRESETKESPDNTFLCILPLPHWSCRLQLLQSNNLDTKQILDVRFQWLKIVSRRHTSNRSNNVLRFTVRSSYQSFDASMVLRCKNRFK